MQVEDIQAVIVKARDAWMMGNADAVAQLFAPEGEFIVPGQCWRGQREIHQAVTEFVASSSDVQIEIQRILVDGEQAVVEWTWEDTDRKTGQRNRADDAIVVDFKDGLIRRWREYIDSKTPSGRKQ